MQEAMAERHALLILLEIMDFYKALFEKLGLHPLESFCCIRRGRAGWHLRLCAVGPHILVLLLQPWTNYLSCALVSFS